LLIGGAAAATALLYYYYKRRKEQQQQQEKELLSVDTTVSVGEMLDAYREGRPPTGREYWKSF